MINCAYRGFTAEAVGLARSVARALVDVAPEPGRTRADVLADLLDKGAPSLAASEDVQPQPEGTPDAGNDGPN